MQQNQHLSAGEEEGEGGAKSEAFEALTRLSDRHQMENYLTYGRWDLTDADIEKLIKDKERKDRVSIRQSCNSPRSMNRISTVFS